MRKNLRFMLVLALSWLTGMGAMALDQVEGVYQIATADQLIEFAGIVNAGEQGANAVLTADIDMTGKSWTPIGDNAHRYVGTFDGQYHKIDNLKATGGEKFGIFGVVDGGCVIKNLVAGPGNEIKGTSMIGGIIGVSDGSGWVTLENVGHEGYVEGTGNNCCAFFGVVMNGGPATRMTNCYNTGNIKAGGESAIITGWFGGHGSVELKGFWNTGQILGGGDGDNSLWRNNAGITIERVYSINAHQGATKIEDGDLASGKLAFLLNSAKDAGVWHQNLEGDSKDAYPTFIPTHAAVYANGTLQCDGLTPKEGSNLSFSNTEGSTVDAHNFVDDFCTVCGAINVIDEVYQIGCADALVRYSEIVRTSNGAANAVLTKDINMQGKQWTPIGQDNHDFKGHFNGQGHRILNLTTSAGYNNQALFGQAVGGAIIENVIIDASCTIQGNAFTAGILGHVWGDGVIVRNCGNEAKINGSGNNAAGIIGCSEKIVHILNCYNTGEIVGANENAGICAWMGSNNSTIKNCFSTGAVTNGEGLWRKPEVQGQNVYQIEGKQGTAFTAEDLASGKLAYMLNGNSSTDVAWYQKLGTEGDAHPYPFGTDVVYANGSLKCDGITPKENSELSFSNTENSTVDEHQFADGFCTVCGAVKNDYIALTDGAYSLATAKDIVWFAAMVNSGETSANARLTADIDFADVAFTGIGNGSNHYKGNFDGQGHIVKNMVINLPETMNLGFFNEIENGAVIKNFTIDASCSVKGKAFAAAFVGHASGNGSALLECLGNEATVETVNQNAGALVGCNTSGELKITVKNSYNAGAITSGNEAGGLSGWLGNNAVLENCYNMGTVTKGESFARGNNFQATNCFDAFYNKDGVTSVSMEDFTNGTVYAKLSEAAPAVWYLSAAEGGHPVLYKTQWGGPVNGAIAAAEAFAGKTTTVLQNALTEAITAAKAAAASQDDAEIDAKVKAMNEALAAAKAVDITVLEQTIAVAEEGVDLTEANDFVANGTSANVLNDVLYKLRTARKINALRVADTFTGATPAADTEYFLYNIGTGMWLANGSDWNTHAAVDIYPLAVKLIAAEDGKFKMQTHMFKNRDEKWINWNAYVDTPDQNTWTFNPVEGKENVFTINSEGNRTDVGRLLGYDPFGPTDKGDYRYWSNVAKDREDVTNPNNQWKLVTRDELNQKMAQASKDAPVDVSYLIDNPGLSRVWSLDNWAHQGGAHMTADDDGDFNRNSDYAYEYFDANSFSFTQELSNLTPGMYEVAVSGFFRQGNGAHQANIVNENGTLISEAYLTANSERVNLPNIATEAGKLPGIASQATNEKGAFVNWGREVINAFQTGLYKTSVKVIVANDGKLTIGVGQDQKTTNESWVMFDSFRLYYLGNSIDISEYLATLNTAIAAAEAFDANTTSETLATALTVALNAAKEKLTSEVPEEITAAAASLTTALNAAKAVNVVVLKQTIALAEEEEVSVTAAKTVAAQATAAAEVEQALYDLRNARKINALGMEDTYKGSAPKAGKVYIYNVGTGLFLGTGSNWNTHAAVDQVGIELELIDLEPAETNNFRIKTNRGGGWMAYNGYVDAYNGDIWHFLPVDGKEGVYNISSTGADNYLLGYDPNFVVDGFKYWNTIAIDRTGFDNPMNQWKVITADERAALIEAASEENPVDLSYLIKNASLNRQDGYDMWTKACDGGNGGARVSTNTNNNGDCAADYAWEYFEPNSFSFTQTLEGLKPGLYTVMVQGFFRNGNGQAQAEAVNKDEELVQLAYLVANDEKEFLSNIATETDLVPGMPDLQASDKGAFPNMPATAIEFFEHGAYWTMVEVEVGEDGKLTIGVKKDERLLAGDWTVFDNFRLVYMGAKQPVVDPALEQAKADLAALIATAKATSTTGKTAESVEALNSAITAAEKALAAEDATVESLTAAKTALQAAIDGLTDEPIVDGISTINAAAKAGKVYNAGGQKVDKAQKGVYILNNKKVMVK